MLAYIFCKEMGNYVQRTSIALSLFLWQGNQLFCLSASGAGASLSKHDHPLAYLACYPAGA